MVYVSRILTNTTLERLSSVCSYIFTVVPVAKSITSIQMFQDNSSCYSQPTPSLQSSYLSKALISPQSNSISIFPSHSMNDLPNKPTTATKNKHTTTFSLSDSTWKHLIKIFSSSSAQRSFFCSIHHSLVHNPHLSIFSTIRWSLHWHLQYCWKHAASEKHRRRDTANLI